MVLSDRDSLVGHGLEDMKLDKNYMGEEESNMFLDRPLPSERDNVLFKYDTSDDAQGSSVLEKILINDSHNPNGVSGLFNDGATNHDFLAQIPLSPKNDGDGSDCDLSDLSSSYWSARVSTA